MRNKKDRIFVIKSTNYSEADKIIQVFGRNRGRFSLLAKGIRKIVSKNRGNIQTFTISDISYYESSGIPLLLESEQVAAVDYQKIETQNARRVLELIHKLMVDESPNEKVFDSLEIIVREGSNEEMVNKFRTIFLVQEGMLGNLSMCSLCGSSTDISIDKNSLEPYCAECISNTKLNSSRFLKGNKEIYKNSDYTISLDKYIKKIIEQTT